MDLKPFHRSWSEMPDLGQKRVPQHALRHVPSEISRVVWWPAASSIAEDSTLSPLRHTHACARTHTQPGTFHSAILAGTGPATELVR